MKKLLCPNCGHDQDGAQPTHCLSCGWPLPAVTVESGVRTRMKKTLSRDAAVARAITLIERRDQLCFDICAETSQIFDNVKHMRWFTRAVADAVMESRARS